MNTIPLSILFLTVSFPLLTLAISPAELAVTAVCSSTHDPNLCTSTTVRFAGSYPLTSINAKTVLEMHLLATSRRASAAKEKAAKLAGKSPPAIAGALRDCMSLYGNIIDLIGVSTRAIGADDQQTKLMVNIGLMQIRQAVQQCDMSFQKMKVKNPVMHFDGSLLKMSINCDDLNNIM
ncbi:hypothetical protein LUZ60_003477 [Juncus effusus]|nr:hypothetical protein LUZ60_003477 [Juncus effusus]